MKTGNLISIGKVAQAFGVSCQTIRNWSAQNRLTVHKTLGGHRRYEQSEINNLMGIEEESVKQTIAYARVSSQDQKQDLERQTQELENYCQENALENVKVIKDIGSGINYKKRGLKKLITEIVMGRVGKLIIAFQDRLVRFGNEILLQICELLNVEVLVLNEKKEEKKFEEKVVGDVLSILTVYCSKIYGRRSHRKRIKASG